VVDRDRRVVASTWHRGVLEWRQCSWTPASRTWLDQSWLQWRVLRHQTTPNSPRHHRHTDDPRLIDACRRLAGAASLRALSAADYTRIHIQIQSTLKKQREAGLPLRKQSASFVLLFYRHASQEFGSFGLSCTLILVLLANLLCSGCMRTLELQA